MRNSNFFQNKHIFLITGLALLLFLLSACGTNTIGTTTTGSSSSPAVTATTPKPRNCGIIHTLGLRITPADQTASKSTEDCFWQAYQQCSPATLIYAQGGVDAATLHTFSLQSQNGKCVITDTVQHVVYPRTPTAGVNDTCTALTQQADGLHFKACSNEGDILVPGGTAGAQ